MLSAITEEPVIDKTIKFSSHKHPSKVLTMDLSPLDCYSLSAFFLQVGRKINIYKTLINIVFKEFFTCLCGWITCPPHSVGCLTSFSTEFTISKIIFISKLYLDISSSSLNVLSTCNWSLNTLSLWKSHLLLSNIANNAAILRNIP